MAVLQLQQEDPPTKRPIPLAQARAAAEALVRLLTPVCTRIAIAGSVRREKAEVGDIELVAVPRTRASQMDLFGESRGEEDELGAFVALLQNRGVVSDRLDKNGRAANGERFKRLVYHDHQQGHGEGGQAEGIPLDLFIVKPPAQFGVIYTLRTGSAAFSRTLVTPRLMGGWLPAGMRVKEGGLYDQGRLVETPEEAGLLSALGLPFLVPARRTDTVSLRRENGVLHWEEGASA